MEKIQEIRNKKFDWHKFDNVVKYVPNAFITVENGIIQPFDCYSQFTDIPNDYAIHTPVEVAIENEMIQTVSGCYPLSRTEIDMLKKGATIMPVRNTCYLWAAYNRFEQEKLLAETIYTLKDNIIFIELLLFIKVVEKGTYDFSIPKEKYPTFALRFGMQDFISCAMESSDGLLLFSMHQNYILKMLLDYANNSEIAIKKREAIQQKENNIWELIRIEGKELVIPSANECKITSKQWKEVKIQIENIGGVWVAKNNRFAFEFNPSNLFERVKAGEKVNFFQESQYFPTPLNVIDTLIKGFDFKGKKVCEPSAGNGIIAEIMRDLGANVDCVEYTSELREVLHSKGLKVVANNFLTFTPTEKYDLIVANPPFSKSQDVKHVRKMYDCLKVGGVLRSVMSTQWQTTENKVSNAFRLWIKEVGAVVTDLGKGAFKESNTDTPTCIVEIVKQKGGDLF